MRFRPRFTSARDTWARDIWNRAVLILATGLGIGYVPVMPGTFGTLLGLPLAWFIGRLDWSRGIKFALEGAIILAAVPICQRGARHFGRPDPGSVVFDEIAALPLVFLSLPVSFSTAILGFVWFRVFDITKPWPVRGLERLPGGWGIVMDDVGAAVYAAIALWLSMKGWHALAG